MGRLLHQQSYPATQLSVFTGNMCNVEIIDIFNVPLLLLCLFCEQLVDTQILFPSYCNIHLTVTMILHHLPAALHCTSLMVCKTLSAKIHRKQLGKGRQKKWQIFNKRALATQLEMTQSLQPNTLWFTVFILVFNSQFHSSWHTHNMLFQPHSSCPACTFDTKKGKKKKNHFYKIFSLGIKSMSSDQRLTGYPLKLDRSLLEGMNGKIGERFQRWQIALSELGSAL